MRALMFHPENRHIESTNPIVRNFKSLQWVLIMMCATLLDPNQPNHYLTPSPVRARERQIRAPKRGILGGQSRQLLPDACYRLSVQRIHCRYKSCRATCYVTNLDPKTDTCQSTCPETRRNTTLTCLEHARPST